MLIPSTLFEELLPGFVDEIGRQIFLLVFEELPSL